MGEPSYTAEWPGATVSVDHAGKKKRSAEPHGYYGYYGHPYGYYGYPYLHHVAHPALKVADGAVGVHPGGATSSVSRSPQGLRGKRSADPYFYGYYGHPGYGYHGYGASSYVGRTVWGLGK